MKPIRNIHPGEVLQEEFLEPMEITAYRLAKDIKIPQTRISAILKGERSITADTALRLSAYFGNSAKFWLGLQNDYDVEAQRRAHQKVFQDIDRMSLANVARRVPESKDGKVVHGREGSTTPYRITGQQTRGQLLREGEPVYQTPKRKVKRGY